MMEHAGLFHFIFLAIAIVLEIIANLLLKYSNGFQNRWLGFASISCVLFAFSALAQTAKGMELSIAYAVWGGFGIFATVCMGWTLFGQRVKPKAWFGIFLLITAQ